MEIVKKLEVEPKKFEFIDILRGVAILMVIASHFGFNNPPENFLLNIVSGYGHLGVQLFFIVSAYTLCLSRASRGESFLPYISRRYFRIFPLYFVGIVIYTFINVFLLDTEVDIRNIIAIILNFMLLHGLYPLNHNDIVPGGWSIGTEMVFYWIFPLLYSVLLTKRWKVYLLLVIFGSIMTFLLVKAHMPVNSFDNYYYHSIFNQVIVFVTGLVLFKSKREFSKKECIIGFLGFTLLTMTSMKYLNDYSVVLSVILSSISFSFLFLLAKQTCWSYFDWLQEIGRRSYSMYIFHFLFAKYIFLFGLVRFPSDNSILFVLVYIVIVWATYLVSGISKKYIEDYFIVYGKSFIKRKFYWHQK